MRFRPIAMAIKPLSCLLAGAGAGVAHAALIWQPVLAPPLLTAGEQTPVFIQAEVLEGEGQAQVKAEGGVRMRKGGLRLNAQRMSFDRASSQVEAIGDVEIWRGGDVFRGPRLQLDVDQFLGRFDSPQFELASTGAGGKAQSLDFLGKGKMRVTGASYTSCRADDPAWVLQADQLDFDAANNEGVARGAVLRFMGVPILGAPVLSFPFTGERKSGWLPPTIYPFDSRSGTQVQMPWYWNLAPNMDATLTPMVVTRRGAGLGTEWRYMNPWQSLMGQVDVLPSDRQTGENRWFVKLEQEARWGQPDASGQVPLTAHVDLRRVSDNDYWRDFPRLKGVLTPRLLSQAGDVRWRRGELEAYFAAQRWQILQDSTPEAQVRAPYERVPQLGMRWQGRWGEGLWGGAGLHTSAVAEFNRFERSQEGLPLPPPSPSDPVPGLQGQRWHGQINTSWPLAGDAWQVTPMLSLTSVRYGLDQALASGPYAGRQDVTLTVPSVRLEGKLFLERDSSAWGQALLQRVEPRIVYTRTPFRDYAGLPMWDSAARDFNMDAIYESNDFTGWDRFSDTHAISVGATSRWMSKDSGAEWARLGLVQKWLLDDQRVTPDQQIQSSRVSDLILFGSTQFIQDWALEGTLQYSPEMARTRRSVMRVAFSPGPFRTVSLAYRLAHEQSEQVELAWQWPLAGFSRAEARQWVLDASEGRGRSLGRAMGDPSSASSCGGRWLSVGRLNYSLIEQRWTDSILGIEYDSGCWAARVVAERLSAGRAENTTRVMVQLELVGLSRLGANPIQVLRDNIAGYRPLREEPRP